MIIRNEYILACALVTSFALASCEESISVEESREAVAFGFESRAGSDEGAIAEKSTYRICAYSPSTYNLISSASFFLNDETDAILTPCALDDDGNIIGMEPDEIIERSNLIRNLFIVSPGIKVNNDGSFNVELGKKFFAPEDLENVNFGGYGTMKLSSKLKEYKSLIGFRFLRSNEGQVDDFTISDVEIRGAGRTGDMVTLFPLFKQVVVDQESSYQIICDDVKGESKVDSEGNLICYETKEENLAAVMPGIYAAKKEVADILIVDEGRLKESNYIVMWCQMSQSDRINLSVHINISVAAPIYKPQHKYIYNVIVSSNYLNVKLDVYKNGLEPGDWQHGSNQGVEISDRQTIDCGTWSIVNGNDGNDWQVVPLGQQVIE